MFWIGFIGVLAEVIAIAVVAVFMLVHWDWEE